MSPHNYKKTHQMHNDQAPHKRQMCFGTADDEVVTVTPRHRTNRKTVAIITPDRTRERTVYTRAERAYRPTSSGSYSSVTTTETKTVKPTSSPHLAPMPSHVHVTTTETKTVRAASPPRPAPVPQFQERFEVISVETAKNQDGGGSKRAKSVKSHGAKSEASARTGKSGKTEKSRKSRRDSGSVFEEREREREIYKRPVIPEYDTYRYVEAPRARSSRSGGPRDERVYHKEREMVVRRS